MQDWFYFLEVEHLTRTISDHAPMLLTFEENATQFKKPSKFLKLWRKHESFKEVVSQN